MDTNSDKLADWIVTLRQRMAHGDLIKAGQVQVGDVLLMSATQAARLMLADLDRHDLPPKRRRAVLSELRRLREQIG